MPCICLASNQNQLHRVSLACVQETKTRSVCGDMPGEVPCLYVGSYTIKALSLKLQRYIDARRSISLDFEFFHQFMPSTHTLSESSDCCLRQTQTVSALSILHQQPGNKRDSTATRIFFGLRKKLSHPGGLWPPRLQSL